MPDVMRLGAVAALVAAAAGIGWYIGQRSAEPTPDSPALATAEAGEAPGGATPDKPLDWRARIEYEDKLPAFTEPAEGPRTPTAEAFGLRVGQTTLEAARQFVAQRGMTCKDTSARALMAAYRDKKVAELEEAKARGEADGTSGASWLWRATKHENNPGVRLACEKVRLSLIGDRPRPEETIGRLLLIFDSPKHPLRHITIQRSYPADTPEPARAALIASEAAMIERLGPPSVTRLPVPAEGQPFAKMASVRRLWTFGDLEAKVSAFRYDQSITVYEEIGVPWPVRADAPTRKDP